MKTAEAAEAQEGINALTDKLAHTEAVPTFTALNPRAPDPKPQTSNPKSYLQPHSSNPPTPPTLNSNARTLHLLPPLPALVQALEEEAARVRTLTLREQEQAQHRDKLLRAAPFRAVFSARKP